MKSSKSKSSREIYTRLLLQKEHGYPLWIPEPDRHLPEAYRGKGVRVGDVSILRNDGGFDYLFNACKPADDPINKGRVPEGFEPIICADIREIETMHKRGSDICSANVSRVEMSMGGAAESPFLVGGGGGFEFSCLREQGAILVLPDGGTRYDALNLSQFRSYAARNAHAWYQFANIVCGREAVNGSLYLVTGCDKTCSWGAASFFSPADTRSLSLKFLVGGVAEGNIKLGYSWKSTSAADVRAYPDAGLTYFVDSLRLNQCVFLRGFGISIRTNAFSQRIFGPTEISQISGTSKDRIPRFHSSTPYTLTDSYPSPRLHSNTAFSLYPEISPPPKRRRQQLGEPLFRPPPVTPPPFLAPPLPRNPYSASSNTTLPGWNTDSPEELYEVQRRLRGMNSSSNAPSQEPRAYRCLDASSPLGLSILRRAESHIEAANSFHSAIPHVAPMEVDATPDASSQNGVTEDEFEFEDNADGPLSLHRYDESDVYSDAYNVPTRAPTLPLTINKHDVFTGGTVHNPAAASASATPSSQISALEDMSGRIFEVKYNDSVRTEYSGSGGTPDASSETSVLRLLRPRRSWKLIKSSYCQVDTQDPISIKPPAKKRKRTLVVESEQYEDASAEENVHGKEKKPKLEPPELSSLHGSTFSADNQHENSSMTRSTRDSATSSYRFPQTHDGQMNPVVQRYDVDKPVEGVASPSEAGTSGLVNLQHSGLGTDDDTSSVPTLSSTQRSPSPADLTEIARSFQPQTELLDPCAKINEFMLNTHSNANVAITHSSEWSSALSQDGDSDILLRVLSDYKAVVRNGVARLEAR